MLIWWLFDDARLGATAAAIIEDKQADCFVSIVSFWEISMKWRLGRLNLPATVLDENVQSAGWSLLAVQPAHLTVLERLQAHHRDPFDH